MESPVETPQPAFQGCAKMRPGPKAFRPLDDNFSKLSSRILDPLRRKIITHHPREFFPAYTDGLNIKISGNGNVPGPAQVATLQDADHSPFYIRYEVAPGIVQHRFCRGNHWSTFHPHGPVHDVLSVMRDHSVYSLVEIQDAKTSVVGPLPNGEGLFNPIGHPGRYAPNSVVINFGYCVHCPNLFRRSENERPLGYDGWGLPVGKTSITSKCIPISKSYKDLFEPRVMADESYATAGPSLHEPLDFTPPTHTQTNSKKGRFHYWVLDSDGNRIRNPVYQSLRDQDCTLNSLVSMTQTSPSEIKATPLMKGSTLSINAEIEGLLYNSKGVRNLPNGTFTFATSLSPIFSPHIRSLWTTVPGNISHATEPNERNGITEHPNGTLLSHSYTCRRQDGVTINQQREIMIQGARFLGYRWEDIEKGKAYGVDGGPSITQAFIDARHQVQVLSQGGLDMINQPFPLDPTQVSMREVANALVVQSGVRPRKRGLLGAVFR